MTLDIQERLTLLYDLAARLEARREDLVQAAGNDIGAPRWIAGIEVDLATRSVMRDGAVVDLAPKEFDLLVALLRHDGAVVSRQRLLDEVWGYASEVVSRTVDTHVSELRRKLEEDPSSPRHILTVRKAGYRLAR